MRVRLITAALLVGLITAACSDVDTDGDTVRAEQSDDAQDGSAANRKSAAESERRADDESDSDEGDSNGFASEGDGAVAGDSTDAADSGLRGATTTVSQGSPEAKRLAEQTAAQLEAKRRELGAAAQTRFSASKAAEQAEAGYGTQRGLYAATNRLLADARSDLRRVQSLASGNNSALAVSEQRLLAIAQSLRQQAQQLENMRNNVISSGHAYELDEFDNLLRRAVGTDTAAAVEAMRRTATRLESASPSELEAAAADATRLADAVHSVGGAVDNVEQAYRPTVEANDLEQQRLQKELDNLARRLDGICPVWLGPPSARSPRDDWRRKVVPVIATSAAGVLGALLAGPQGSWIAGSVTATVTAAGDQLGYVDFEPHGPDWDMGKAIDCLAGAAVYRAGQVRLAAVKADPNANLSRVLVGASEKVGDYVDQVEAVPRDAAQVAGDTARLRRDNASNRQVVQASQRRVSSLASTVSSAEQQIRSAYGNCGLGTDDDRDGTTDEADECPILRDLRAAVDRALQSWNAIERTVLQLESQYLDYWRLSLTREELEKAKKLANQIRGRACRGGCPVYG